MYFLINSFSEKYLNEATNNILIESKIKKVESKDKINGYYLFYDSVRLSILNKDDKKINPIFVDFESKKIMNRLGKNPRQTELLYKAIKGKQKISTAIDGTAGMGVDSMILAKLGYQVSAFEKNSIVYLLLQNGLDRALKCESEIISTTAKKIQLQLGDVSKNKETTDLLYLDFMFDNLDKKTKSKKNMELFKDIVKISSIESQNEIINNAVSLKHTKIIVKRPLKTNICKIKAYSHSIIGKSIRFDIYLPNK